MRVLIPVAAVLASGLALAACQPEKASTPTAKDASASPSPTASASATTVADDDSGQDDPDVVFTPAPVDPPQKFIAVSTNAMGITGDMTMTSTPQVGPNGPHGMTFSFAKGFAIETMLDPGGAMMGGGGKAYDFKTSGAFPTLTDPERIEMYYVEQETPAPGKKGTLCDKVDFIATFEDKAGLHVAVFTTSDWPPSKPASALCATYMYAPAK